IQAGVFFLWPAIGDVVEQISQGNGPVIRDKKLEAAAACGCEIPVSANWIGYGLLEIKKTACEPDERLNSIVCQEIELESNGRSAETVNIFSRVSGGGRIRRLSLRMKRNRNRDHVQRVGY
ncbi:MAG TPA: hypothetical protein VLR94_11220, partial [Acidobacteriota bacterium]|nr:hypothetical protein [Acidobacteriota bacterium]